MLLGAVLARIFEYLPLVCPRCGNPMRLIAFILDPPVVERILGHIGKPTEALVVLSARSSPQGELSFDAGVEAVGGEAWPEIDQTGGGDTGWFQEEKVSSGWYVGSGRHAPMMPVPE